MPVHLAMHLPAVRIGLRVVGVELDRAVEVGERFLVAPRAPEHAAAHIVGLRVVRIARHHFAQRRDIGRRGVLTASGSCEADGPRLVAQPPSRAAPRIIAARAVALRLVEGLRIATRIAQKQNGAGRPRAATKSTGKRLSAGRG